MKRPWPTCGPSGTATPNGANRSRWDWRSPQGDNWLYLVRSLPVLENSTAREVLQRLVTVDQLPDDPEHIRQIILCGLRLKEQGADKAIAVLELWTGEQLGRSIGRLGGEAGRLAEVVCGVVPGSARGDAARRHGRQQVEVRGVARIPHGQGRTNRRSGQGSASCFRRRTARSAIASEIAVK